MAKALQVFTCVFTNTPPENGVFNVDNLPASEKFMFQAVEDAQAAIVSQSGGSAPLIRSLCYAGDPQFADFLKQVKISPPFMAAIATYPDGQKRYFATKDKSKIGQYINALLQGEFGGTGLPTNPGDGNGGWGQGDGGLLCQLLPPLCALGFLPWLALSAYTTYRAVESRSTVGRAMWGIPAFLFWQGFLARGGVKQIQWWIKQVKQ